ncbi:hypothetical protein [Paenibacillus sp. M2]|uniref:hypothetical protein n=1 Tax=Paenibacillus sp. M2 TaxID=3341793 RepID=UPI00398A2584
MRQFGLTYDDAVDIQKIMTTGLKLQRKFYDANRSHMSNSEKIVVKIKSKRAMKKIAYLNNFTKARSKSEIRELGKLVVE